MHRVLSADIVLTGGLIRTLDDDQPDAQALAISGDRIVWVGIDADAQSWVGENTEVVELDGAVVIPGINDAHLHLALFAETRMPSRVDLSGARSVADIRESVARMSTSGDGWIVGHHWHDKRTSEFADGSQSPHRSQLDFENSATPVVLHHDSLHSVWVNSAALTAGGIDAHTPDPDGGRIERDHNGDATGILYESAGALVTGLIPPIDRDARLAGLADAMAHLNSMGVTSITDPVVWPELLRDYVELRRQDRASVRVSALLHWDWPSTSSSDAGLAHALRYSGSTTGFGDHWVRIGGIKLFADGVPSARTACVHDPYPDGTRGDLVVAGKDPDRRRAELTALVRRAHRNRLDVQIHVTGDKAADLAIDAIAAAQCEDPFPGARHALIHGTLLSDDAPERLRKNNIGVVVQSLFKYHSGAGMVPTIGRARWDDAFPVRRLLDAGVLVADSTDAPCVEPDWRLGMSTFCGGGDHELARLDASRTLTRREALHAWTRAGAQLERASDVKGTIAVGKLADLAVLDTDPLTATTTAITETTVIHTIVGGRTVYSRSAPNSEKRTT